VQNPLMSTPQSLFQATVNRLGARLGSQLADKAAEFALFAQDAPQRLQQEWTLFWEEVELEARRIDHGEATTATTRDEARAHTDPQDQIDALRAKVTSLSHKLEQPIRGGDSAGPV